MSREGISMRKVKEIMRLKNVKMSQNAIAKSCKLSSSTVGKVLKKAEEKHLEWPLENPPEEACLKLMDAVKNVKPEPKRAFPDMDYISKELKKKGVTRHLLWEEYHELNPDGYSYSQFCNIFGEWSKSHVEPTMRFEHKAGEKGFVDWAGKTLPYYENGEEKEGHLFIATLGGSSYTYAGVYPDEKLPNWTKGHTDAYKYFGGVPQITVPDNPKTAVSKTDLYDPDLNPAYYEMAAHYGTVIMPARPGHPRDKAKAENAVQFAERWIIGALRNMKFLSFGELQAEVKKKNIELNRRPFAKMEGCREKLFLEIEKKELMPLPEKEFSFGEWKKVTVHIDYHIQVEHHFYSVPYQHIGKLVEARLTGTTLEIFLNGTRIALHKRSYEKNKATTLKEHMPPKHSMFLEGTMDKIIDDAGKIGPSCKEAATEILTNAPRPEMGFRSCLGLIRLAKHYTVQRLEKACAMAVKIQSCRYSNIRDILEKKLEDSQSHKEMFNQNFSHRNVRGGNYYSNAGRAGTC